MVGLSFTRYWVFFTLSHWGAVGISEGGVSQTPVIDHEFYVLWRVDIWTGPEVFTIFQMITHPSDLIWHLFISAAASNGFFHHVLMSRSVIQIDSWTSCLLGNGIKIWVPGITKTWTVHMLVFHLLFYLIIILLQPIPDMCNIRIAPGIQIYNE